MKFYQQTQVQFLCFVLQRGISELALGDKLTDTDDERGKNKKKKIHNQLQSVTVGCGRQIRSTVSLVVVKVVEVCSLHAFL